jgi:YegS/Rv2252/BmrU family lipid kinase
MRDTKLSPLNCGGFAPRERKIGLVRDRIKIIVNPVSGEGRARRLAEAVTSLLRAQGCTVDLQATQKSGDARRLAADCAGYAALAATGGDGTVNEVLNGLPADGAPALAMLPSGTANVLAKELHLPRDPAGLARVLREGREAVWDLGIERVSGRKFLLFASAGYDAHVVHIFHAARSGPIRMWQYIYWGLKSILEYSAPRIAVEIDGTRVASEAAWVTISNVACYGGPLLFTPRARPDDRTFEVMIQRARQRRDVVRMFFAAILGWLSGFEYRMGGVTFHQASRVRLTSADGRPVPVQVDGDPAGHLPGDFEIVPGGIRVLAPPP